MSEADNIFFVHPGHQYDSYQDYWRLVTLSGWDIVSMKEVDFSNPDHTYILTMLFLDKIRDKGGWPDAKAKIIYYDLEWYDVGYAGEIPGITEYWSPDKWYANKHGYRFVPLGSHPKLVHVDTAIRAFAPQYDVVFMAYMDPHRRRELKRRMEITGLTLAPNAWGNQRERILEASRVLVHIHQHGVETGNLDDQLAPKFATVAAQRFAFAAAAKIPIVSEFMFDSSPFEQGTHYFANDYDGLIATIKGVLDNGLGFEQSEAMHELLCHKLNFTTCIKIALGAGR